MMLENQRIVLTPSCGVCGKDGVPVYIDSDAEVEGAFVRARVLNPRWLILDDRIFCPEHSSGQVSASGRA